MKTPTPAVAQRMATTQSAAAPSGTGTVVMDTAVAEPPIVNFPFGRILRVSPLTPIAPFC